VAVAVIRDLWVVCVPLHRCNPHLNVSELSLSRDRARSALSSLLEGGRRAGAGKRLSRMPPSAQICIGSAICVAFEPIFRELTTAKPKGSL
jgi:hypothetical protein